MTKYLATFADGSTISRTSKRDNYTHAYRSVGYMGQTRTGFCSSADKALRTGKASLSNSAVEVVAAEAA